MNLEVARNMPNASDEESALKGASIRMQSLLNKYEARVPESAVVMMRVRELEDAINEKADGKFKESFNALERHTFNFGGATLEDVTAANELTAAKHVLLLEAEDAWEQPERKAA